MKYNTLGKTGLKVSALGLGGHEYRWSITGGYLKEGRFTALNPERLNVVRAALEGGVNYFDTTFYEEVQSLGHCLHELGAREQVVVNGMSVDVARRAHELSAAELEPFIRREVDTRLELLKSDHFDIFMICNPDGRYERGLAEDILAIYLKLRDEAKFSYLGVSWHELDTLVQFLSWRPPIDAVMFRYNYSVHRNWHGQGEKLVEALRLIKEQGLGTIAIKAFCWFHYGVPFTACGEPAWDAQADLAKSIAWHVGKGATDTTVVGVETAPELKSFMAGVDQAPDEAALERYLPRSHDFSAWLANAPEYSDEIRWRMVQAAKGYCEQDLGDGLAAYQEAWEQKSVDKE